MKPTPLGWLSIIVGACIVLYTAMDGLNLFVAGFGALWIVLGGLTKRKEPTKVCPHCRSEIHPLASVCPHCQRDQVEAPAPSSPSGWTQVMEAPPPPSWTPGQAVVREVAPVCPKCRAGVTAGDTTCARCGVILAKAVARR